MFEMSVFKFCLFLIFFIEAQARYGCFNGCNCYPGNESGKLITRLSCKKVTFNFDHNSNGNSSGLIFSSNPNRTSPRVLRNMDKLKKLYLQQTSLRIFNWNWLPDSCEMFSFRQSNYKVHFWANNLDEYHNHSKTCHVRPQINVTGFILYGKDFESLPSCLPPTLNKILVNKLSITPQLNLTSLRNLTKLVVTEANITESSNDFFRSVPQLTTVWIRSCSGEVRFRLQLPANLTHFKLTFCNLSRNRHLSFSWLSELKTLGLRNTNLTECPTNFPSKLHLLHLSHNKITRVDPSIWNNVTELEYLDLSFNKLRNIPLNLPATIKYLLLNHNKIAFFDSTAVTHLKNLKRLEIKRNRLLNLPTGLSPTIRFLMLNNNNIALVRSVDEYLYCANCSIFSIAHNAWICNSDFIKMLIWMKEMSLFHEKSPIRQRCASLQSGLSLEDLYKHMLFKKSLNQSANACNYDVTRLICVNSNLHVFPPNPPVQLNLIDIRHNRNLTKVPDGIYSSQTQLTRMYLDDNSISAFPKGLPVSLEYLSLRNNRIKQITNDDQPTLNSLKKLKQLFLGNNDITKLYGYQLLPMTSLLLLDVFKNPLHCDCSLQSLSIYFIDKLHIDAMDSLQVSQLVPTCATPTFLNNRPITTLTGYYDYFFHCIPSRCSWDQKNAVLNCSLATQLKTKSAEKFDPRIQPKIPLNSYWKKLDLSGLKLTYDVINLQNLTGLKWLNIEGNNMTSFPPRLPPSIKHVIASDNSMTSLFPFVNVSKGFPSLKMLDLRNNKFGTFTLDDVRLFARVDHVLLGGNPLKCDCDLKHFIAWIQSKEDKNQFEGLNCFGSETLFLVNITQDQYCPLAEVVNSVVGPAVGASVALLVVLLIVTYVYQKRKKEKTREEIFNGFQDLLWRENELDELKQAQPNLEDSNYDAFVSYCNSDADMALALIQDLELRGLNLCFHERDFRPGVTIADNIVEKIKSSKHVILMTSRAFLKSEWCRYEVTVSLTRLNETKNHQFMIPLLVEDLARENLDLNMKTVLAINPGRLMPRNNEKKWKKMIESLYKQISQ